MILYCNMNTSTNTYIGNQAKSCCTSGTPEKQNRSKRIRAIAHMFDSCKGTYVENKRSKNCKLIDLCPFIERVGGLETLPNLCSVFTSGQSEVRCLFE